MILCFVIVTTTAVLQTTGVLQKIGVAKGIPDNMIADPRTFVNATSV